MYSRATITAIAVLAVCAPSALAAPTFSREVSELQARGVWQDVYDWGNKVLDTIQAHTDSIKDAADVYHKVSSKSKRDEIVQDLLARQQSGALSWQDVSDWGNKALDTVQEYTPMIKDAADIYSKVSGKERRDELLARQQSGALSWQDVSDWGNKALDTIQQYTPMIQDAAEIYGKVTGKEKREILARLESGALSWDDVKNFGGKVVDAAKAVTPYAQDAYDVYKIVEGKREVVARDLHTVLQARATNDQSGAISWDDVKDFGKGFVQGFTKTAETVLPVAAAFVKRDELDIFARELADAVVARQAQDLASGAISWDDVKDFGKGFVQGFTKTAETVLPIAAAFVKRDEIDNFTRDLQESGALSWDDVKNFGGKVLDTAEKVAPYAAPIAAAFLKRDELMVRAALESGALSWDDVKNFGGKVLDTAEKVAPYAAPIAAAFLKRDEVLARAVESGALSWDDVKNFGGKVLDTAEKVAPYAAPIAAAFLRRDEVLARAVESGALSWDDVKNFGGKVLDTAEKVAPYAAPIAAAFLKRDEVLARAVESGALSWDDVKNFGSKALDVAEKVAPIAAPIAEAFLKRDAIARATADQSGAISWDDVKDFGKGFVQGFTKTAETVLPIAAAFVKRDEIENLTRDLAHLNDLLARQESGAISWDDVKDFGKGFVQGFTKTAETVLPIAAAFVKREDLDMLLLARELSLPARSLNELD